MDEAEFRNKDLVTKREPCANCNGAGHILQMTCDDCDGTGLKPKPRIVPPEPEPAPETVQFQIVYAMYTDAADGILRRGGKFYDDKAEAIAAASDLMEKNWSVQDVFVCTVHAAFAKNQTVERVI
jgi:DnaJ-class molecular chaperone